jgi:hypothetical protein
MSRNPTRSLTILAVLATVLAYAALAGGGVSAQPARSGEPAIFEGPGGRTQLTRWTLRRDPGDRGLARGWARGGFAGVGVSVPNVVDPVHYSGKAGTANFEGSVAWYRTSFGAGQDGLYALTLHSANFLATVWVDGRRLGAHRGSYLPFELRTRLAAGTHTVVVRVDWRNPAAQARSGFHRTWFNWGGLDGEVEVRPIGASELSLPTLQTTLTPDAPAAATARVRVSVQVRNNGEERTIEPEGSLTRGPQTIPLRFSAVTLEPGQTGTATATATVPEPALWSTGDPALYRLAIEVGRESSYVARVGLRELTWHGGRLYLNGARVRLHGASLQEDVRGHADALTPADEDALVRELREIGANAVRTQHPLDPALLERLDAAGMLVWQGIGPVEGAGNWYSRTPTLLAGAERQARVAAESAQLHPSVFAWNLVDEVAGNGHDSAEVSYVRSLTAWLHSYDPTRMVGVDVWGDHPPSTAGALYSGVDAIAETDYSGWYDFPHASPAEQVTRMRARLSAMERTFPGRVLVISEFGAESNGLNASSSPGGYAFQSRLLARHVAVYAADHRLTAMFVWVLCDYPLTPQFRGGSIHAVLPHVHLIEGLNQKGVFTYSGQPKPAVAVLRRLFGALGG